MNWREHLRILAILVNGLFALFLIGTKGWWWPIGFGMPMIVRPSWRTSRSLCTGLRGG
jgi:hypothetical protein